LLAAVLAARPVPAEVIFTETFAYGPGVPDRQEIQPGDSMQQNRICAGGTPWEGCKDAKIGKMVFAPGGGLTVARGTEHATIFISVDPRLFSEGSPVRVELDIIPGDAWGTSASSRGVWMGFADTDSKGFLANIKGSGDHLALRYAISRDSSESRTDILCGTNGEARIIRGPKMPSQPGAIYRMALVYNPSDRSFEAGITGIESGETMVLADTLAQAPNFNVFRVDFIQIDTATEATLPVVKSISLKK
jgi:hypothetical protein